MSVLKLLLCVIYYFSAILILTNHVSLSSAMAMENRSKRSSLVFDDSATIRTEVVDGNNRQDILKKFNLTEAEMTRIYAGFAANREAQEDGKLSPYLQNIKEFRLQDIKTRISNALQNSNSDEIPEHPLHEMAAYPTCNSETTEYSWFHDNNVTIQFSHTLFEQNRNNLNLDSAILRLYKINPNTSATTAATEATTTTASAAATSSSTVSSDDDDDNKKLEKCTEPQIESQIRVTVSMIQRRNKRERKKRLCNTVMMNVSKTGWVEIDIKHAINTWESTGRQMQQQQQQQSSSSSASPSATPQLQQTQRPPILVGWLMIEVHDEEEQPLKPGLFFKPPKCPQVLQSHGTITDRARLCLHLQRTKCQGTQD